MVVSTVVLGAIHPWFGVPLRFHTDGQRTISSSAEDFGTQKNLTIADDFSGALVMICGTASPFLGCTCKHHPICGSVVHLDIVVRLKTMLFQSGKCYFCSWSIFSPFIFSSSSFIQITMNIGPF